MALYNHCSVIVPPDGPSPVRRSFRLDVFDKFISRITNIECYHSSAVRACVVHIGHQDNEQASASIEDGVSDRSKIRVKTR